MKQEAATKREGWNRQAVLATTAEPEVTDLGSGECVHEAADTQDDMRKDQQLQGLQRHVLALRTEPNEVKDQWVALQKLLRLQAMTDKGGHTETIPKSACDSGHLEADNSSNKTPALEELESV